jgi:hypothetical protein
LDDVRFATNIRTIHGQAITIGSEIFFPGDLDFSDVADYKLMFHELEHVVQYAQRGGIRQFIAEYIAKVPHEVIARRSFDVHDEHEIERAAIRKSETVLAGVYGKDIKFKNSCRYPVRLAINYLSTLEQWTSIGYWTFGPDEERVLADDQRNLHTKKCHRLCLCRDD